MENQASIRDFFNKIQAASSGGAQLPWEVMMTVPSANKFSNVPGAPALSRSNAFTGEDYGVGLPPLAG